MAHKDLVDTAGIRTTRGSPFYRDNVPTSDALIVTRMRAAGAITCGKTNTPEFGAGSQTFNTVFGATRNPYDLTKTCGGSSGGAAVALACGMVPIADGSDTGGSLRNPPAFCNVVGLRPSPGRVPATAVVVAAVGVGADGADRGGRRAVPERHGGPDPGNPLSIAEDGARFRAPLGRDFKGVRVAWWQGLGGIPFEPEIRRVVDGNRQAFEDLGCVVEEAEPDFAGVDEAFPILRYSANHPAVRGAHAPAARMGEGHDQVGGRRSGADDRRGHRTRDGAAGTDVRPEPAVLRALRVLRAAGHAGRAVRRKTPYPTSVAGTPMATYIDWMRSCWYVTFMANPAIRCRRASRRRACPSAFRSSAGTATTGACSRSRTRSSRRPVTGPDVRLCESHARVVSAVTDDSVMGPGRRLRLARRLPTSSRETLQRAGRSAQIKMDRAVVWLDVNRETQEPTALPLGLHHVGDQRQRVAATGELHSVAIGSIFKALHPPPKLREKVLAPPLELIRLQRANNRQFSH